MQQIIVFLHSWKEIHVCTDPSLELRSWRFRLARNVIHSFCVVRSRICQGMQIEIAQGDCVFHFILFIASAHTV